MPATVHSCALVGVEGRAVTVEVDVHHGLPAVSIVGLPGPAVREAKDRLVAGLRNSRFVFPSGHVTFNLAPGHLPKAGPAFDLPMAVGLLAASGQLRADIDKHLFYGEVALDGSLRSVHGVLPVASFAARAGLPSLVVPLPNAREAALVEGVTVRAATDLSSLVAALQGSRAFPSFERTAPAPPPRPEVDLGAVRGQPLARRAVEVAAAGGHNLLMTGPPGSGKTLLARCLPSILPPLALAEALEVSALYSVAGLLPTDEPLIAARPFRAPHHTCSAQALTGGGAVPRPGEVSLAHHGVLFLDELPEFGRPALEALRGPLEDGKVSVSRVRSVVTFPARFSLVAARNPCPCGHSGDPFRQCTCPPGLVERYSARVSGPLLDRFDLHVDVPRMETAALVAAVGGEPSGPVAARVAAARLRQAQRYGTSAGGSTRGATGATNASAPDGLLHASGGVDRAAARLLAGAVDRLGISARGYHRLLRVARTIADLAGTDVLGTDHMAEALQYRRRG